MKACNDYGSFGNKSLITNKVVVVVVEVSRTGCSGRRLKVTVKGHSSILRCKVTVEGGNNINNDVMYRYT